jgi:hydrogenase maturation protease
MSVLVAGVGNIFLSDDGFGPEVARVLGRDPVAGAKIEDFGIRGMHLAYELLTGHDRAILVDAVARGGAPGTVYVIEPDTSVPGATADAHRMDLGNVFAFVRMLGGEPPPIVLVGCEPASIAEGIGLSPTVRRAIPAAVRAVRDLLAAPAAAGANR